MTVPVLPTVNACLNAASFVLLVTGWRLIRGGRRDAHRACMVAALAASIAFLACYLVWHARVGSVKYEIPGWPRRVYLAILLTHTVLAALIPFLASAVLWQAWRGRFDRHRRLARWTLPAWLYVSCTGIVIYLMLYVFHPARIWP